jgi:hypothetical protein
MKKLSLLFAFVVLTMFVACNGGDDPVVTGIELADVAVEDVAGYFDDYGTRYYGSPVRGEGIVDTHRSYAVLLTDGTFGVEACWPEGQSFNFWMYLYSPDIAEGAFVNGTYDFAIDWPQGDQTGVKFGDFYGSADQTETYYDAAEGTVTISGSFPNVTAKVDLDVYYYSQGMRGEGNPDMFHTLTGTFKGTLIEQSLCD